MSDFITFVLASYACRLLVAQWYETRVIVDTRDTCAVSRYFLLPRYTAVYRDFGDTGIVTEVSTISIEVSRVSHTSVKTEE